jgi:hypothetical protein
MSRTTKQTSGSRKTVVAKEMNNKAEALSKVRDAASEFHDKLFTMSEAVVRVRLTASQ